jgi:phenylpyruvate tautomerase PptA (4-oxalocrotonate tautomerase family)
MPFINSKISIKMSDEEKDIIKTKLGCAIELIPGKSENWLMIGFDDNYSLYFKGQPFEKIAYIEVKTFGSASKEAYSMLTNKICNIYNEVLGIPKDRIYVKYEEVSNWGWNGENF